MRNLQSVCFVFVPSFALREKPTVLLNWEVCVRLK